MPAVIVGEIKDQQYPNIKGYIIFATPVLNEKNEITGTNLFIADVNFKQSSYKQDYKLLDNTVLADWINTSQIDESKFLTATTMVTATDGGLYNYVENNQEFNQPVLIFFTENTSNNPLENAFLHHEPFNTEEILRDISFTSPPDNVIFLK